MSNAHRSGQDVEARLGYRFSDRGLVERALCHRSSGRPNNERLEFLGDSILEFIITDWLYQHFPRHREGDLTRMRARLVNRESLAALARNLDLGEHLHMGVGELKSGGHNRDSILADALEALIGAVYLDGGIEVARHTVHTLYGEMLTHVSDQDLKDNKTRLQELLQGNNQPPPVYEVVSETGDPHRPEFTVRCLLPGSRGEWSGVGSSRKRAEQDAAARALEHLCDG